MSRNYWMWSEADDRALVEAFAASRDMGEALGRASIAIGHNITRASANTRFLRLGKGTAYENLGLRLRAHATTEPSPTPPTPPSPSMAPRYTGAPVPDFDDGPTEQSADIDAAERPISGPPAVIIRDDTSEPSEPKASDGAAAVDDEAIFRELAKLARKPSTLEELCDRLDMSPRRVREVIDAARARGIRVEISRHHVGIPPHTESNKNADVAIAPARAGQLRSFAIVGDVHAGSQHHLAAQLRDFCDYAYHERGVRVFLQVGDLLDGVYQHSIWEQSHRGYEEQIAALADTLPEYPGATWAYIQGNHDETLGEKNGMEVGRAIERDMRQRGRKDLVYLGARGAYVRLIAPDERRGLFVHLWHPRDKGSAYAKSYRLQKTIEKYAPGTKPDVLAAGHWHQQFYFKTRGVHAMSCGCWQGGGSSFSKSLGGQPEVGSWIVDYSMTDEGTVRSFRPEWRGYEEREAFRDVALG